MIEFSDELKAKGLRIPPFNDCNKFEFFEQVASLAVQRFPDKNEFMAWIVSVYKLEKNRFAASACWDIIKLRQSASAEEVEYHG